VRTLVRTAIALLAVAVPLIVVDGSGSAAPSARAIGVAHHGPLVRPASFDGDLRTARARNPLERFRVHPEPKLPPAPHFAKQALPEAPSPSAPPPQPTTQVPAPTATSFDGLDFTTWGDGHPPDTVGDVGPNDYVEAVNTAFAVYDKSSGQQLAAATFTTLWQNAPDATAGLCKTDNFGDPTVVYDPMADRFVVADFAFAGDGTAAPYYECIAVSKTSDPVAGGWWLYAVRTDDAAHPWLADYPKMGIWPTGLYMSANMFSPTAFQEVRVWAFNRSDLESGAALRQVVVDVGSAAHFGLLPANLRGALPPNGTDELFAAESTTVFGFEVYKFHVDYSGNTSALSAPVNVAQTSYSFPVKTPLVPTPGNNLDSLTDRLMMQAQYRNINGVESLWVTHSVYMSSHGPYGMQWAQLNVSGGTISTAPVQQQIYGNVGSDGVHRWMGSLAVDDRGDMALGYSAANSTLDPAVRYAGRLAEDALGSLPRTETTMIAGGGTQTGNCGSSTCTRWGDYSAMTIDPVDGCTFWYAQEYYAVDGLDWHTRIGEFAFPSCTNPSTVTTPSAASGTFGGTTNLSATLTSAGAPVVGRTVSFTLNGVNKGSASTNNNGVAAVSGVSIAGINAGSYATAVGASFAGDDTYPPSSGTASLTVAKADQTIAFTGAPASAVYNTSFGVTATASSGLAVTVTSSGACTNSGTSVTMTSGTGTCTTNANQAGNGNYNAAFQATQTTAASKAAQSVALTVPATKVATDAPFQVSGTATSGLPVALGLSSGPCTISGSTVTITGTGDCVVSGDQAGDGNWLAAPTAQSTIAISKAGQTISFAAIPSKTVGDSDFDLSATASSGLPVTFFLPASDPCTLSGSTVHLVHAGTCHVTASQSGDDKYNSATSVTRDIVVQPAATSVGLALSRSSVQYSDPVTMTATVSASTVPGAVRFSIGSTTLGTAPVAGGVATLSTPILLSPGSRAVSATFLSGDTDFADSNTVAGLTVTPESARVSTTAPPLVFTRSVTTGSRTIRLRASVTDAADGSRGDIRRAVVTFVDRRTGTAFSGCVQRSVRLVTSSDTTRGFASCSTTVSAPARPAGNVYRIGTRVGGSYGRSSGLDDVLAAVARPLSSRLLAAGGALRLRASAGRFAGAARSLAVFGVTSRWSADRTVVRGAVDLLIVHSHHRLLVRTSGLTSIRGTRSRPRIAGVADVTDVTNPAAVKLLARSARLVLTAVDGKPDQVAIELRGAGGRLLFSSRWSGSATLVQALLRGAVVAR
jgi:hypothetical protein